MDKSIDNPMSEIFKYLAISILFMFIGFILGQMFIPESFVFFANAISMFLIIGLLIIALLSRKTIIPRRFSMNFVYAFTFIDGILTYPLLQYYLEDLGKSVFTSVLLASIVLFAVLAKIASRKEAGYYLGLGNMLFAGLIGIIIALILNIFMGGTIFSIVLSIVGIVIFTGYTLYDISLIKYEIQNGEIREKNDLSIHVLNLYLDFINIVLDMLDIASILDD